MARRTAISRSRALARASIRLARFAQAMSSTSAGHGQQDPQRLLVVAPQPRKPRLRRGRRRACIPGTPSRSPAASWARPSPGRWRARSRPAVRSPARACRPACSRPRALSSHQSGAPARSAGPRRTGGPRTAGTATSKLRPTSIPRKPAAVTPTTGRSMAVQAQRAADGGRVAAQLALPEGVADHHARARRSRGTSSSGVRRRPAAARTPSVWKKPPLTQMPVRVSCLAAVGEVERRGGPGRQATRSPARGRGCAPTAGWTSSG